MGGDWVVPGVSYVALTFQLEPQRFGSLLGGLPRFRFVIRPGEIFTSGDGL